MPKLTTSNLADIPKLAKATAKKIKGGEIFALLGPLGAGKTAFVKAVGRELKIKHKITSPTFTLMHNFPAKLKTGKKLFVYHLDLYRIKKPNKAYQHLGLEEFLGRPDTVTFIEWADKIRKHLPAKTKFIKFLHQ
jgi:tRNA threonylcarbamoyladenosine biosynthesis protein TsaE